ncbi:L-threonylcarbamoyladenylate synthase [Mycoplasma sp. P36-A1]|uniref:L-threonylcarbamoyladenylate synthase n=1 Tax=Mycoplasma sp. P36-A1 TaxID=3252900 RepID=UPI003C2C222A
MLTKILKSNKTKDLKEIVENDGVIAFPTETVFGIGIRSDSFLAYNKLFDAKKRPQSKQLTLMLHNVNDIKKYAQINETAAKVIEKFMPGPITIVLPKLANVNLVGLDETVGIRVPDDDEIRTMLENIQIPMYVTSANISGQPALEDFDEVYKQFNGHIEAIVKGDSGHQMPSTVVNVSDQGFVILREGTITLNDLKGVSD